MYSIILKVFLLLVSINYLNANNEKINLLLKWTPQFQFAGYYMAKEKGFYDELGLNVKITSSIKSDNLSIVEEKEGYYGVFGAEAILEQAKGKDVRVLAAILQNSPVVFLSLEKKNIETIEDLKGKRVTTHPIFRVPSLELVLKNANIKESDYTSIKSYNPSINDLINDNTDVIYAYLTDAPYQLKKLGYKFNIIDPIAYGVDFYSDLIFTSKKEVEDNPSRVKRFLSASKKGWAYALENIDETINIIQNNYNSKLSKDTLEFEARKIKELMLPQRVPIGSINNRKVSSILEAYYELGETKEFKSKLLGNARKKFMTKDSLNFWKKLSSKEKEYLQNTKSINIGMRDDFAPFNFKTENNENDGFFIDLLNEIETLVGTNIKKVSVNFNDYSKELEKLDALIDYTKNYTKYNLTPSKPIISLSGAAYSQNNNLLIDEIKDLYGKKVIIVKGSIAEKILSKHNEIELVLRENIKDMINTLYRKDGDIIIAISSNMNYMINKLSLDNIYLNGIFYKYVQEYTIGTKAKLSTLSSIINKAVDFIAKEKIERLKKRWLNYERKLPSLQLNQEQKEWIKKKKELIIGNDAIYPPYDFYEDSEAKGYSIDIIKLLASKLNLKIKTLTKDWDILIDDFKNKKIDILTTVYPSQEMKNYAQYTKAYINNLDGVITHKDNDEITDIFSLEGKKVAIPEGYEALDDFKNDGIEIEHIAINNQEDMLKSIVLGKSDAAIMNLSVYDYYKDKLNINSLKVSSFTSFSNENSKNFHFAVQKEENILKELLDKAYVSLDQELIKNLKNKWFISDKKENEQELKLNKEEKDFLSKQKTIKVGTDNNWPPFDFSKNSKAQGYSVDFYKLLEKQLNIKFEFVNEFTWSETVKKFKNKELDMLSIIGKNKQREEFTLYSSPILSSYTALALRKQDTITTIDELIEKKKTIGLIKGFWIEKILRENYPTLKIKEFPSALIALEALSKKEIDAYIDSAVAISYQVNRHVLSDIKISDAIVLEGKPYQKFHLGIRKDWDLFHRIIQKAINNIKEEDILNLQRKWFGNVLEGNISKQVLLSSVEKKFLNKNKTIKFGIDTSWPPYEYVDSNGDYQGVVKDMSEYLLKESLGLNLYIKKEKTWSNHIKNINDKKIDVIGGISYSQDRLDKMIFSDPYIKIPLVIVGKINEILINNLKDLNGKEVGLVKGYITEHIIRTKYPNIKIKVYNNIEESLYDLSRGVINYVFDSLPTINYVIQQEGITNLKLLVKTNESVELSFGVRKDWPELVVAINKMIKAMPKERKSNIVNKWLKLNIEKKIDYELIWKIVLGFIFIVIIIVYWNRKLASEIERRKIIEKELKEAREKADLANRSKSEFLSNMSHEIRTPMNAVIGFAELTSKMDLPSKALKNINIIQKSSKALVTIINDILDLSKIEAGKLKISKQATNIVNLAEELNAIFINKAEQKGLFFDITFVKNCSSILIIDEVRIRQILINLIGNAFKFTDKGHVLVSFESIPNLKNDDTIDLIIKVEDTGIGIDKEDIKKVFGMFEQQSSQDNRLYGGTGLGLSISNKLAALMDGNITLKSKKGKGSEFSLKLDHIEIASTAPTISKSISNIEFENSLILVVDDIQNNIDLLDNILKSYGFTILVARNGQEAVDITKEKQPSLILMDLKMPILDGFEASKIIKKNPKTSHIPIIVISASVLGSKDTSPQNNAFDEFLPKPVDISDLENSLSKFLKHKKSKILTDDKTKGETNIILNIIKNKENILLLANDAYNNGDLQSAEKLIEYLEKENIEESFINNLKSDIESLDIENVENKMKLIIDKLE